MFTKKPHETIKSLAKFLNKDLSEANVDSIVKWCSFETMKENKMVNYEWYKEMGIFKKQGIFNLIINYNLLGFLKIIFQKRKFFSQRKSR